MPIDALNKVQQCLSIYTQVLTVSKPTICVRLESITFLNYENNIFVTIIDKSYGNQNGQFRKEFLACLGQPATSQRFLFVSPEKFFLMFSGDMKREHTAQKMKFSIKDFFNKCDQIRRKLRISSHLLKKSLMENFILCTVTLCSNGLVAYGNYFFKAIFLTF